MEYSVDIIKPLVRLKSLQDALCDDHRGNVEPMYIEEYTSVLNQLGQEGYNIDGLEIHESAYTVTSSFNDGRCCDRAYFQMKIKTLVDFVLNVKGVRKADLPQIYPTPPDCTFF